MTRKPRVRRKQLPVATSDGGTGLQPPPRALQTDEGYKGMTTDDIRTSDNAAADKLHQEDLSWGPRQEALRVLEAEEGPEVGSFFRLLLGEGMRAPGDSGLPVDDRPAWLDEAQLREGQRFAQKYFGGLALAEMLSLFLLFVSPGSLQPLIFSGNSDTPAKACRRYLSTVRRVRSWYTGDLWAPGGEAGRHLRAVRHLHALSRSRLRAAAPAERQRRCALRPPLLSGGSAALLRRDLAPGSSAAAAAAAAQRALLPFARVTGCDGGEWLSQMEMSVTQWAFLGLMVTFPGRFGAGGASDAELEAFVHLWRVLAHLLGVRDRFNWCAGGLRAVRLRSRALLRHFLVPALAHADAAWEHMARCVVDGGNMYAPATSFEVVLLYLCETVGAETPHLRKSLSWRQAAQYAWVVCLMTWLFRVPPLRALLNWNLHRAIDAAQPPPLEAETEAEPKSLEKEAPRRGAAGPSMWLTSLVFAFLTLVQIAIALVWASQPRK